MAKIDDVVGVALAAQRRTGVRVPDALAPGLRTLAEIAKGGPPVHERPVAGRAPIGLARGGGALRGEKSAWGPPCYPVIRPAALAGKVNPAAHQASLKARVVL